jgi:hypothetical protein
MTACRMTASKAWRTSGHAVMDGIPLDIQESIIITITTLTPITKEPSRAARVPTTSTWILTLRTMLDPPRLPGRSAHERAVHSRMKARAQVESSPGAEATTANFGSVRDALQKHLFPLTIKLPIILAIYQTLSLLVTCFWIDINVVSYFFSFFSFFFISLSVVTPGLFPSVSSLL